MRRRLVLRILPQPGYVPAFLNTADATSGGRTGLIAELPAAVLGKRPIMIDETGLAAILVGSFEPGVGDIPSMYFGAGYPGALPLRVEQLAHLIGHPAVAGPGPAERAGRVAARPSASSAGRPEL